VGGPFAPLFRLLVQVKALPKWLSDEGLTRKASLNALAVGLDYVARMGIGFVIAPLMVAGLGDYLYGSWQVLSRIGGYVSAASGRPTQALKWAVANDQASTDYDAKRRMVGSAIATWLLFLPLLGGLGAALAWWAPALLDAPPEYAASIRLAAGFLALGLIAVMLAEVPRSVLQGENLGYKRMGLSTVLVLIGGGLTAAVLLLGGGIVGVAVINLVNTIITGVIYISLARSYVPWFGVARPSSKGAGRFLGLSWWFLLWRLVNQLMLTSDVVVLGILVSAELVTTYSLVKAVPETLISFVAIVVGGITPGLGGIIGSGDLEKASRIRTEIMSMTWFIAAAVGTTILVWNRAFVRLWVGEAYRVGPIPSLLIMVMAVQLAVIRNDAFFLDLTLDLRHKVLLGGLSAGLSLVFAGILVGVADLGIIGLCLGFMAGRFVLTAGYPRLISRYLGTLWSFEPRSVLRPAAVTAVLFLAGVGLGELIPGISWVGLVPAAGVTLVVASVVAYFAGLTGQQRWQLWMRVKTVVRPPRAT
jgi:O-antigen/teichoic acid export membrane protein